MRSLWCVLLIAGCGGGGSVAVDNLGTEMSKVACSKMFECCSSAEIMQNFMNVTVMGQPITTEAQCESFAGGLFQAYLVPEYKASIAAGRITYDANAAGACLDAFANLGCGAYAQLSAHESVACDKPFITPKVADGGACSQDYECTGGYCKGASSGKDGACTPKPAQGADCTDTCAAGSWCGYDQTAMKEICQPTKANGATCNVGTECTSGTCTSGTCMDRPLVCDGN